MTTNFQGKKFPKEKAPSKCLSIVMLDSVIKAKKKCYPQTFLEECKYEQERIKIENLLNLTNLIVKQNLILIMTNLKNILLKEFQ